MTKKICTIPGCLLPERPNVHLQGMRTLLRENAHERQTLAATKEDGAFFYQILK